MHQVVKDLLLNVFFISLLPLLLVSTWEDKLNLSKNRLNLLLANLIAAGSAILCMTFPVNFSVGFIFDLRQIPIIFACLYLGYRNSLLLVVLTLGYRFLMGGEGFYIYLITQTAIFLIVPLFRPSFFKQAFSTRLLIVSGFSIFFSTMALALSKSMASVPLTYGEFAYVFVAMQLLGILITAVILEYIKKNINIRDELVKAAKMQMIGEMAASVSHEIRNPLTVSRGFIQLLKESGTDSEDRENYINLALQEIDSAKDIIDEYLILANPYPNAPEEVALKDEIYWVEDILQSYSTMHNVQIKINAPEEAVLLCERKKIRQVLVNLGKNAIEAMPEGGVLIIEMANKNGNVEITFLDNGTGMDTDQLSRLGEPYFTTKSMGTGLGLMVVWRIVQSLGGKIEVSSKPAEGTDIKIFLPTIPV
ncbi:ATP-binding protein [Bacillus sp. FJAT-27445]|uniref:ATP-binding protein n=1 Tax=Bacillus sp. FJAT-27445 TaxID=1679166 RepID=UPI000743B31D|nr:ATP-binding protein [Bacillus sp. FJAT-27445]